jgi:ornithine carbamoyltransferase
MKRDFLTLSDVTPEECSALLKRARELKAGAGAQECPLIGKSVGLYFEKPSTRTRVSFEVAVYQLGGQAISLDPRELQLGRGETLADTAKVLSRYLSAMVLRTYSHQSIADFASHASIPTINGLSDLHHPCQALADMMTILERKGRLNGIRIAYIGDGNNVANSLIEAASLMGMDMVIASPEGHDPSPDVLDQARQRIVAQGKGDILILRNPKEAAGRADVIYTDVWVSMGQEKEAEKKKSRFRDYQVNAQLLQCAKNDVIVLHCLPAHRGEEITDEVIDGSRSAVFDQAENRLHTEKALLEFLIA